MAIKFADDKEGLVNTEVDESPKETPEEYSERVQRRINKLTGERRAESDRASALEAQLQRTLAEKAELEKKVATSIPQDAMAEQLKARLESAKKNYVSAYDTGDKDALVDAQIQIADITADLKSIQQRSQQPESKPAPVVQAPRQQAPNPTATDWAAKNSWFRNNNVMTAAAFIIDNQLASEGYDPNDPSYFQELDKRLAKEFPHKYREAPRKEVVSGSGRQDAPRNAKSIELNDEERRIARVFGLTEDQYKEQKARVEAANGQGIEVKIGR